MAEPKFEVAKVRKVRVDADKSGQRIDNFLRRELPGVPRSRLYRLLRRGEVRVNGGRVRADYRLQDGDEVRVPPAWINVAREAPPASQSAAMLDNVLYEDKRLLVIDKPSGTAVHGGSGFRLHRRCQHTSRSPLQPQVGLPGRPSSAITRDSRLLLRSRRF